MCEVHFASTSTRNKSHLKRDVSSHEMKHSSPFYLRNIFHLDSSYFSSVNLSFIYVFREVHRFQQHWLGFAPFASFWIFLPHFEFLWISFATRSSFELVANLGLILSYITAVYACISDIDKFCTDLHFTYSNTICFREVFVCRIGLVSININTSLVGHYEPAGCICYSRVVSFGRTPKNSPGKEGEAAGRDIETISWKSASACFKIKMLNTTILPNTN
jgi:hypothetical protein